MFIPNVGKARTAAEVREDWDENPCWEGITRDYVTEQVAKLQGTVVEGNTLARRSARILWEGVNVKDGSYTDALDALTGNMAVQQARAGLKTAYLSGWQVVGDVNLSGHTYPDQSLYPANSAPNVVRRINDALLRADEVARIEGDSSIDNQLLPIVADGEAGFDGALNIYELQKTTINTGTAGTRWENQLASEEKCGHLGDKVLIPTQQHTHTLTFARLTVDVSNTPTVIIAHTDAKTATLTTSGIDECDQKFITDDRTSEDFYHLQNDLEPCIDRARSYAPYADMVWIEIGTPDPKLAKKFAKGVKAEYPSQLLAYNCSPSFNWSAHLEKDEITKFQNELGKMGFRFQFITLASFHALNHGMFDLAYGYAREQMSALVDLQNRKFETAGKRGFTAVRHQREVGASYFSRIATTVDPNSSTTALKGSTEEGQF